MKDMHRLGHESPDMAAESFVRQALLAQVFGYTADQAPCHERYGAFEGPRGAEHDTELNTSTVVYMI